MRLAYEARLLSVPLDSEIERLHISEATEIHGPVQVVDVLVRESVMVCEPLRYELLKDQFLLWNPSVKYGAAETVHWIQDF